MIDLFPWNSKFETGIEIIDSQHKGLVALINKLAVAITFEEKKEDLDLIFISLAKYAEAHFSTEEKIWEKYFQHNQDFIHHQLSHKKFIDKVTHLQRKIHTHPSEELEKKILSFLSRWLAFHILDDDMRMSYITKLMDEGFSLEESKKKEAISGHKFNENILETTINMYEHLSQNTIALYQEINKREAAEKKLTFIAQHDGLTQLPNRRLFAEVANFSLHRAKRNSHQEFLMFIDIDGFKMINDQYGHQIGDELLVLIAERLKKCIRLEDIIARFGGDEFLVHLAGHCEIEDAKKIAEKINQSIAQDFKLSRVTAKVSASIGIAHFPEDADNIDDLLEKADAAMYKAKKAGKNSYCFYQD